MVDGIFDRFKPLDGEKNPGQRRQPNPSDVHAMSSSRKKNETVKDLGSLFSGQIKALVEDKKDKDELESRLNRYKAQKKSAQTRVEQKEQGDAQDDGRSGQDYDALAREVAEQILTGVEVDGRRFCKNEVIIRIKRDILEGCHIHLIGEEDCLQVRLVTSNAHSLQTLIEAQHMLIELLEKHYDGLIRLSFHMTGQGEEIK